MRSRHNLFYMQDGLIFQVDRWWLYGIVKTLLEQRCFE